MSNDVKTSREVKTSKKVKPARLSQSASYTIGGKVYKTHNVSGLQQQPSQEINTDHLQKYPSEQADTKTAEQTIDAPRKSSYNPKAKTPDNFVSSESTTTTTPTQSKSSIGSRGIKTDDEASAEKSKTRNYHSQQTYKNEKKEKEEKEEKEEEKKRTPLTVNAVKTAAAAKQSTEYKPTAPPIETLSQNRPHREYTHNAEAGDKPTSSSSFTVRSKSTEKNVVGGNQGKDIQDAQRTNIPVVSVGRIKTVPISKEQVEALKVDATQPWKSAKYTPGKSFSRETSFSGSSQSTSNPPKNITVNFKGEVGVEIQKGKDLAKRFATGTESKREYARALGAVASYTVKTEAVKALKKIEANPPKMNFKEVGTMAFYKAKDSLNSDNDLGSQSAGGVLAAGAIGVGTFKAAQFATEIGVDSIKKVGKGVYHVSTTAGLTTITVAKSAKIMIKKQVMPLSKEGVSVLKAQAKASGLTNTKIVKGIVNKVDRVKTAYHNAVSTVVHVKNKVTSGVTVVKDAAVASVKVVRGAANGTLKVNEVKASMSAFRNRAFKGIKVGVKKGVKSAGGYAVRGIAKGASGAVFKGVPLGTKLAKKGAGGVVNFMMNSEDDTVRGVGTSITTARIATKVTVKTAVVGTKATTRVVKTSVKGTQNVYKGVKTVYKGVENGVKYVKDNGAKKAAKKASEEAAKAAKKAGEEAAKAAYRAVKAIVKAVADTVKAVGMKFLIPAIAVIVAAVLIVVVASVPLAAVGSIFGGIFQTSDTSTEFNVREYLRDEENGIPKLSENFKTNLVNEISGAVERNECDIVRFYSNTGDGGVIEPTYEKISALFWNDEELANIIQPMFTAVLLKDYDLSPTESEAEEVLKELFEGLYRVTSVASVEHCGQSLATGEGTVTTHECGSIHALADCPNYITGTHTSYTCSECDEYYYICEGHASSITSCGMSSHSHSYWCESLVCGEERHIHEDSCYSLDCTNEEEDHTHDDACYSLDCDKEEHIHDNLCYGITCGLSEHTHSSWISASNPGCYRTGYHVGELDAACSNSTEYFRCNGYSYCEGHDVLSYTLNLDGIYALEAKYFTDPINNLSNITDRTDEEETLLLNLKDHYEIYLEYLSMVNEDYGGGVDRSEFSNVNFVNGTRVENQEVVDLALSQVGQQGGQPYWSYYGFGSRVEWCACFVHWCMRNTPSATDSYPTTANNAYCQTIANHFKSAGQWGDKDFTNLVAGDVIFFDWQQDGHTDHIGIVVGQDGTYVYTVEGNSGDAVKVKKYLIGSSVIYGYGLINY